MRALFGRLGLVLTVCISASAYADCPKPLEQPITTTSVAPVPTPPSVSKIVEEASSQSYGTIGFGDSNMSGWPTPMLSKATDRSALNASIGGGTQTLIWELQSFDWSRQSPKIVVLIVGTNDLGYTACEVYWGVQADITAVHAKFPAARVVVVSLLPSAKNPPPRESKVKVVNAELKKAAGPEYLYLDVYDVFDCRQRESACGLYQPGDIHLNDDGFKVLGSLLNDLVKDERL